MIINRAGLLGSFHLSLTCIPYANFVECRIGTSQHLQHWQSATDSTEESKTLHYTGQKMSVPSAQGWNKAARTIGEITNA